MRHVVTILPGAHALFTPLNRALCGHPTFIPLSATGKVWAALLDLRQIITTLAARPTHVLEILTTLATVMPVPLGPGVCGSVVRVHYPKQSGNAMATGHYCSCDI
jgi:hypothetical protein